MLVEEGLREDNSEEMLSQMWSRSGRRAWYEAVKSIEKQHFCASSAPGKQHLDVLVMAASFLTAGV